MPPITSGAMHEASARGSKVQAINLMIFITNYRS
jgi:hypothetical protein